MKYRKIFVRLVRLVTLWYQIGDNASKRALFSTVSSIQKMRMIFSTALVVLMSGLSKIKTAFKVQYLTA